MIDITHKSNTHRKAIASALLRVSDPATMNLIREKKIPKGDIFEFSRAAGLLAIKKTSDLIPDCHPMPIEFAAIRFNIGDLTIHITVEVHTIYKTGVEVEAMHGASIVALTIYDMLKPVDKGIEIQNIRLESKTGGKSDQIKIRTTGYKSAVVVCSDTIAAGNGEDLSGKKIVEKLSAAQIHADYFILPDDVLRIREMASRLSAEKYQLVFFTGGTGVSLRDVTPEAITPLITKEVPGIMEAARFYGQQRTPYAMLSRGISGFMNQTLVITLPGSVRGVEESMDAIFPYILHLFSVAEGIRHDKDEK